MGKFQSATLAAVSVVGLSTTKMLNVNASNVQNNQLNPVSSSVNITAIAKTDPYQLAQKSLEAQDAPQVDDEMVDELIKRQERLENLEILNKLNKDSKVLENLQEQNFSIESAEKLQVVRSIVNDNSLNDDEILNLLQDEQLNIKSFAELEKLRNIVNQDNSIRSDDSKLLDQNFAFKMLAIGLPAIIIFGVIGFPIAKGIARVFKDNVDDKLGKPKVPEGSISLHDRAFKEITVIGNKAEKVNDDKFGSEEFKQLIQFKVNVAKKKEGYPELNQSVELLKAAIIAQKSFLKLESTELRYRSRKQQELYQYVAENLVGEIDKEAFAKKVKKKQSEVLPLINTEEGRGAIDSYVKEINVLSQYELGLKLFALFKQYDLKDFSILKQVSDVIEGLQAQELLVPKDLISSVLEKYEAFEKLGPILGISEAESNATTYARVLQVLGLTNRHGKSYLQFQQLVELLKKWEKPYKNITMVREEYIAEEYQIPREFKENIPGIDVYRQYAEYLPDF